MPNGEWEIDHARLEDWASFKACWDEFKAGPDGKEIEGDEFCIRTLFQGSLCFPEIGFLLLRHRNIVRGFAIITQATATQPDHNSNSVRVIPHGFVRAIHIQKGVPLRQSLNMEKAICWWGSSRGYTFLTGHCSEGYIDRAEKAYSRMGWKKTHTVVIKYL